MANYFLFFLVLLDFLSMLSVFNLTSLSGDFTRIPSSIALLSESAAEPSQCIQAWYTNRRQRFPILHKTDNRTPCQAYSARPPAKMLEKTSRRGEVYTSNYRRETETSHHSRCCRWLRWR